MNKTAIKNFAIWARNKLIADVCYRARLVGITEQGIQTALPQSDATTEFYDIGTATPYAISGQTALRQRRNVAEAIRHRAADSDYPTAYRYIMEEVAYTWFNRLIAVRFMEVNDYLPGRVRVLSSESGKVEPDLVTTPFDSDLNFSAEEEKAILQMKQNNQLDELFRLLFIKQCNALAAVLPALFEQHDDYTELLLNLSVVDQDGVVWRLTHDIPEDDFNVEKGGQVEIIGWLYQYYNTEPKAQVFARPSGQKIKKEEIPAATQLFTPDWIVRYMVENSLGRLWLEGHPDEELRSGWKYYLDEAEQEPDVAAQLEELRAERRALAPEDIKVIDPCMGSGHILVYAFDVLMQIYEKAGWERREAARSIVEKNLYGLDIDKRAYQLAYFAVMMKARQYDRRFLTRGVEPQVYYPGEDKELEEFGSLLTVEKWDKPESNQITLHDTADNFRRLLARKYDVVVTNPPYMGGAGMSGRLADFVKKNYPDSKSDLSTAFMEQTIRLCNKYGYMAMINIPVWMFLSSYEKLRQNLLSQNTISSMVHPGRGIFGSDFGTTTFVIQKAHIPDYYGSYRRLFEKQGEVESIEEREQAFLAGKGAFIAQQDSFSKIPGSPVAYWVSEKLMSAFEKNLFINDIAEPRVGMATANNDRFIRLWFEINLSRIGFAMPTRTAAKESRRKWFPFAKGGENRKWYGNNDYVVNWENDGLEIQNFRDIETGRIRSHNYNLDYIFQSAITWTVISSASTSFRFCPEGFLYSNSGYGMFFTNSQQKIDTLGFLNTKVVTEILSILSPTIGFESGYLRKIPYLQGTPIVGDIVKKSIQLSKTDWDSFETSWDFKRHPLV